MNSARSNAPFGALGFPIRTSSDQRLVGNSPTLFAATHVLHRLLAPRHPPHALSSLLTQISRPHAHLPAGLSKLETKVQAQGSSPYGPHFDCCCCCFTCAPSQCVSPWALDRDLRTRANTLETQGQGLENFCSQQKLNSTLRMHLSKSSCPVRLDTKRIVELDGFEPTTSSLQSWRSPN
jgi:hypothetical protein